MTWNLTWDCPHCLWGWGYIYCWPSSSSKNTILSKGQARFMHPYLSICFGFMSSKTLKVSYLPLTDLCQILLVERHVFKFNVISYKTPVRSNNATCFSHFNLLCILRVEEQAWSIGKKKWHIQLHWGRREEGSQGEAHSAMKTHLLRPGWKEHMNISEVPCAQISNTMCSILPQGNRPV